MLAINCELNGKTVCSWRAQRGNTGGSVCESNPRTSVFSPTYSAADGTVLHSLRHKAAGKAGETARVVYAIWSVWNPVKDGPQMGRTWYGTSTALHVSEASPSISNYRNLLTCPWFSVQVGKGAESYRNCHIRLSEAGSILPSFVSSRPSAYIRPTFPMAKNVGRDHV